MMEQKPLCGFLNVLKPPGMSSAAVVGLVRRLFGGAKVGHAGTLDPEAAGVLPLMVGKAARLFDYMQDKEKAYVLGLLHDIGRKFGVYHMPHIYNGWHYMIELGYHDVARVCLSHSFSTPDYSTYIGRYDLPDDQIKSVIDGVKAKVSFDGIADKLGGLFGGLKK